MVVPKQMKYFLLVLFSVFMVACSSNQTKKGNAESDVSIPEAVSGAETSGLGEASGIETGSSYSDMSFDSLTKTIYFGFDRSVITSDSKMALDKVVAFMKAGNKSLRLEGHTDERGSREYNMALGERRGNAVKDYLVAKGVPSSRLEVISYGEEKPAVRASNESAYAKNRRVEIKLN
ncbi:MAG: peptidoglycan-associated lipoprotein Pal [Cellvibrionales bacterium]|nr:peptidoglycan-associated lipoprotein Pal [Cellvibrionales bacterium]